MKIIIKGKPIAKKRPRFARVGRYVKTYNSQETEESRWLWEATHQIDRTYQGPVSMTCDFVFERPKSHFGTGRNSEKLKPSAPTHHVQKPDTDNLLKFVKDCLNGQAYKDDSQVVSLEANKRWGNDARTEIIMSEVDK